MTNLKPFEINPEETAKEPDGFKRGKSDILFQNDPAGDKIESFLEIIVHDWTEGDADIENEASVLNYVIQEMLPEECKRPGWFVVEGFEASYHTDYYGEVDASHSYDNIREATPEEIESEQLKREDT